MLYQAKKSHDNYDTSSISVIGFDLDGTLIKNNTWELLHEIAGISPEQDLDWYNQFQAKKISYGEWIKLIEEAYVKKNITRNSLSSILPMIEFNEDCQEIIRKLEVDYRIAIISSSVDFIVKYVADKLGIFYWKANCHLRFNEKQVLSGIEWDDDEEVAKVKHMQELNFHLEASHDNWAFVGNSYNDFLALSTAKLGVLFLQCSEMPKGANPNWMHVKKLSELESIFL